MYDCSVMCGFDPDQAALHRNSGVTPADGWLGSHCVQVDTFESEYWEGLGLTLDGSVTVYTEEGDAILDSQRTLRDYMLMTVAMPAVLRGYMLTVLARFVTIAYTVSIPRTPKPRWLRTALPRLPHLVITPPAAPLAPPAA